MTTTDGTTTDNTFIYSGRLSARMACHMGNFKPVAICNILGDQPLFYIDYVDQEEADFLDPMSLTDNGVPAEYFADNIDELRRRMARLESASQHIDGYARENIEAAFDKAATFAGDTQSTLTLEALTNAISQSRMLASLLADTSSKGLTLRLNAQVDTATYDRDQLTVNVNPRLAPAMAALAAARALRQAWLHINGAAIHPLHFAPEEAVLLNRIQQADLSIMALRAAWEMNLSGDKSAWARILTISGYDLAVGFAREAIADFRALNNGHAGHAAFERWFFSGRCKDVDRKLIQSMLADNHGLIFENSQVSKMVTNDIIAKTGELPTGKNYLSGLIEIILSDPLFTEVRDRSNANFLWFIKFERSFRASEEGLEHNLQGVPQIPAGALNGTPDKETANAEASVITFTGTTRKHGKSKSIKNGTEDVATVYYIDHFLSLPNR